MASKRIKDGVYSVGAIDWDRQLFDELIPLPQGTSYNSFIVQGNEKTALIDTVDPSKTQILLNNLEELDWNIDYIIANHAEQDHSGSIPTILEKHPNALIITNPKCKELIKFFLLIPEDKFITVDDKEQISLGDKTLEFIYTPWVHWPDTMVTYLPEDKILFSCDFFGSHLASSELFYPEDHSYLIPAKRYYAEIMMPFRPMIKNNLAKLKDLALDIIAPSHGPFYPEPQRIMDLYADWASDKTLNQVLIPYVSMHGSTEIMVNYLVDSLMKRNIIVKPFNLSQMEMGELLMALVDASTIVISSPTVLTGPHPLMANAAYLINALRPKLKYGAIIGSFGWGSKIEADTKNILNNLKLEYLNPILIKGIPKDEDFEEIDKLADKILEKHQELIY
jgi:flavorubredoxin